MHKILNFMNSSLGGKIIMALSGAMIILFLLGHAVGNLFIYSGQSSLNTYAHWLQNNPFLWVFRVSMLLLFSLHIFLAIRMTVQNRLSRPIAYMVSKDIQLTTSAKTMLFSGLLILLFLVFHIAHLTLGWISTTSLEVLDNNQLLDVYNNIVRGFKQPLISVFYLLSMILLGLHLHHAFKSLFQTLGFHHDNFHQFLKYASPLLIITLILAFISIPLAVLLELLPEIPLDIIEQAKP